MIELTKVAQEVESAWPLAREGTSAKWKVISNTQDLLSKIGNIRTHTSDELKFLNQYHETVNSVDGLIIKNIESGYYDSAYLPYDFASKFKNLYEHINHN